MSVELCSSNGGATSPVAREVVLGSHDPHGLRLEDDKVREPIKRSTFSVGYHLPATDAELVTRPLPQLNQPAVTLPLQPPAAPPESPPVVTCVSQVVLPSALARVRTWLRCLRFARQLGAM